MKSIFSGLLQSLTFANGSAALPLLSPKLKFYQFSPQSRIVEMQEVVLAGVLAMLVVLYLIYLIFAVVGDMAWARGHSPWPWWLISLAWSPFGAMFVLWLFFPLQHSNIGSKRRR